MTQEQKDIILHGARYEIMNTCINYITGVVDVEKMAEAMQRYAEMYHLNELSKLSQHNVIKNEVVVCDGCQEMIEKGKDIFCEKCCFADAL